MAHEDQGVEANDPNAPTGEQGVETQDGGAPAPTVAELQAKVDIEAAGRKKAEEERDHYKEGLLRAKGKKSAKPIDVSDPDAVSDAVNQAVEEKLREKADLEKLQREREETKRKLEQYDEMQRVLKASGIPVPTGSGGGAPTNDPTPQSNTYFSPQQRDELKQRGFTDEMIRIAEERALTGSTTANLGEVFKPKA